MSKLRKSILIALAVAAGAGVAGYFCLPKQRNDDSLMSKAGFRYESADMSVCFPNPNLPKMGLFAERKGKDCIYRLEAYGRDVSEYLNINYFSGKALPDAMVFIYDENHDGLADRVLISDKVNNTDLAMERHGGNYILVSGIGIEQADAQKLFRDYNEAFQNFRAVHFIDDKIKNYHQKLVINDVAPNTSSSVLDVH